MKSMIDFEYSDEYSKIYEKAYRDFRTHCLRKVTQDIRTSDSFDFWLAYYCYKLGYEEGKSDDNG